MMMNHLTSYCYFRLHPARDIPLKKLHKNCPRYVDSVFSSGTIYVQRITMEPSLPFLILSSSFGKKNQTKAGVQGDSPRYPMVPLGFHGNCGLFELADWRHGLAPEIILRLECFVICRYWALLLEL